jgi:hypothetical protein
MQNAFSWKSKMQMAGERGKHKASIGASRLLLGEFPQIFQLQPAGINGHSDRAMNAHSSQRFHIV